MFLSVFAFGRLANRRSVCSQAASRQATLACLLLFLLMTLRLCACSGGGRSTHGFHCYSTLIASPRRTVPPPLQGGRGQQMDGRAVEEGALRQGKVGDRVAEVESFQIRPVLFRLRREARGGRRLGALLLAAFGCLQGHLAPKRLGEQLVD